MLQKITVLPMPAATTQTEDLTVHEIVCFVDIGGIVNHHCLEVIVCFVDICGIVSHHCLKGIVCSVN